jgi:hypothetical protein
MRVLVADVLDDEGPVDKQLLADLGAPLLVADLDDLRLHPLVQVLLDLRGNFLRLGLYSRHGEQTSLATIQAWHVVQ